MGEKINNSWAYRDIIADKRKNSLYLSKLHEKSYELYDFRFKYFRLFEIISLALISISLIVYLINNSKFMLILALILSVVVIAMVSYNKENFYYLRLSLHSQAMNKFQGLADQYKNLNIDLDSGNIDYTYLRETLDYLNDEYYDLILNMPRPINYEQDGQDIQSNNLTDMQPKLNKNKDDGIVPKELKR